MEEQQVRYLILLCTMFTIAPKAADSVAHFLGLDDTYDASGDALYDVVYDILYSIIGEDLCNIVAHKDIIHLRTSIENVLIDSLSGVERSSGTMIADIVWEHVLNNHKEIEQILSTVSFKTSPEVSDSQCTIQDFLSPDIDPMVKRGQGYWLYVLYLIFGKSDEHWDVVKKYGLETLWETNYRILDQHLNVKPVIQIIEDYVSNPLERVVARLKGFGLVPVT